MSGQSDQPRWLVKLDGSSRDIDAVKRSFSTGVLDIEDIGDERFLSAPRFADCNSAREVEAEAAELFASLSTAMSIASGSYGGLGIGHIAERTATGLSRTVAIGTAYEASFAMAMSAHLIGPDGQRRPAGPTPRSFAERMTELIERDDRVREAALALAAKPVSWGNLNLVYETVKGFMSPTRDRGDWETLCKIDWMSKAEANSFWATAGHYRHGHPRKPIKPSLEMSLDDGHSLITGLFRRLVDHLLPR